MRGHPRFPRARGDAKQQLGGFPGCCIYWIVRRKHSRQDNLSPRCSFIVHIGLFVPSGTGSDSATDVPGLRFWSRLQVEFRLLDGQTLSTAFRSQVDDARFVFLANGHCLAGALHMLVAHLDNVQTLDRFVGQLGKDPEILDATDSANLGLRT